jgi:hypothetical protein
LDTDLKEREALKEKNIKNMPYDLYGTYYARRIDAENAEMAQCVAIDLDLTKQEVKEQYERQQCEEYNLWQYIHMLEERISRLENSHKGEPNY